MRKRSYSAKSIPPYSAFPMGEPFPSGKFGARDGRPVLYCQGTPGASVEWELFGGDRYASQAGIRLIAADRPGMGGLPHGVVGTSHPAVRHSRLRELW